MPENGSIPPTEVLSPEDVRHAQNADQVAALTRGLASPNEVRAREDQPKLRLDHRLLTIRDMKRARAGPLEGRDPFEVLAEPLESTTLMIWCFKSRTDPEFTWAQAEDTPLGEFEMGGDDEVPPPTATPIEPGSSDASGARGSSKPRRRSATSTGSRRKSTKT